MPYETLNVHVSGPEPEKLKEEIRQAADSQHLSISKFILFCYQNWKKRYEKDLTKGD